MSVRHSLIHPRRATAAALLCLCWAAAPQAAEPVAALTAAQIKTAGITTLRVRSEQGAAGNGLTLSGHVTLPNRAQAQVSATLSGQVQNILVNVGQSVRTGTPLLRIYSTELLAIQRDYLHAQSAAQISEQKLKRDAALYADGIIALSRIEETRQTQQQAAATLQEQRQLLKLAGLSATAIAKLNDASAIDPVLTVSSPMDGVVLEQSITPGVRVAAGDALLKVAKVQTLWIEAQATSAQLNQLQLGDAANVPGCSRPGKVAAISPQIGHDNQTGLVRIEIAAASSDAAPCLRPNQFAEVTLTTRGGGGVISVPPTALFTRGGADFVFVQNNRGFSQQRVTVQSRDNTAVRLKNTLPSDTVIAVTGIAAIRGAASGLGIDSGVDSGAE